MKIAEVFVQYELLLSIQMFWIEQKPWLGQINYGCGIVKVRERLWLQLIKRKTLISHLFWDINSSLLHESQTCYMAKPLISAKLHKGHTTILSASALNIGIGRN